MKIYLICPVRDVVQQQEVIDYVNQLEANGHKVHYPPRDVNQDDPTGARIVSEHYNAMRYCDEVHVFWDANSKGSHFDLGMAYVMGKDIVGVKNIHGDTPGKSYWKAIITGDHY